MNPVTPVNETALNASKRDSPFLICSVVLRLRSRISGAKVGLPVGLLLGGNMVGATVVGAVVGDSVGTSVGGYDGLVVG